MDKIGSLHQFSKTFDHLKDVLQNVLQLCVEHSHEWLEQEIKELQVKLSEKSFYLGVLGEFKRGKSTLLNALIGTDLLPTGVLPVTSIITTIRYGVDARAEAVMKTGQRILIKPIDICSYVMENNNPGNVKNVDRVDLFLPLDLLKDGVVLIDTPGVGSFYEHNTELTYSWLTRLDAAFFLLSPDSPLSSSELQFLEKIVKYLPKVFVVLNKADRLDEEAIQQVLDFTRDAIRQKLKIQFEIYPVSARDALNSHGDERLFHKSGVPILKSNLEHFLLESKGQLFLESTVRQTDRILEALWMSFKAEHDFAEMPVLQLRERLERLRRIQADLESRKAEVQVLLEYKEKELEKWLQKKLESFQSDTMHELFVTLKERFTNSTTDLHKQLFEWLSKELEDRTFGALSSLERETSEILASSMAPYIESFGAMANKLKKDLNQIVVYPIEIDIASPALEERGNFWLNLKDPLDHVGLSAYSVFTYINKSATRKRLLQTYRESIRYQTEGSAGKLRNELLPRIQKSFYRFYKTFDESASDMITAIARGVDRAIELQSKDETQQANVKAELVETMSWLQMTRQTFGMYAGGEAYIAE